jgi:hypothetical protein
MSKLELNRNNFKSRIVRNIIGERTIDIFASLTSQEGEGGFLGVLGLGGRLLGFLVQIAITVGRWLLRNLWELLVNAYFEIVNFDWNQTDTSIEAQIAANNTAIVGALGNLIGTSAIWLTSIGIGAALSFKFPVLAGEVALRLAEEGGEEIRAQLIGFLNLAKDSVLRNIIMTTFLSARKMRLFGQTPIAQSREPWTIADAIDEKVSRIPIDSVRAFVSNFLQSVEDAVIEVGYVVSLTIEDFYATNRLATQESLGKQRAIRLIPDQRVENETIVLSGPQTLIQQNIEATLTQHRFIYNRDVGQIVGQPIEDYLRGGTQRRKLTIVFKSTEKPPWRASPGDAYTREVTATIPEIKTGLTWQEIKTASKRWLWGKFRCTANLSSGRQMAVYGATGDEAEEKLRALLTLSTLDILTISISEEKDRNSALRKHSTMMFPAYAFLLVRRSSTDLSGRTDLEGNNWREEKIRIDLWTDEPPDNLPPLQ